MSLFITSTGTEQGKTYVTRLLCRQMPDLKVIKPVISGYDAMQESDTALLLAASGNKQTVEECSPWRFEAALSPDLAAMLEGREIDYQELLAFCKESQADLIEGAGGVMSPLTPEYTNLDLIKDTRSEALLVSSLYLGCISHILTALTVLEAHKVPVAGLVLSPTSADNMSAKTVLASLTPQLSDALPVFVLEYSKNLAQDWKNQPDLTSVSLSK